MNVVIDSSIIAPIITGVISFIASFWLSTNRSKHELKTLDQENKNELEKLAKKFEIDIEALREKHRLDLESKEKEHQHVLEIKRIEHEHQIEQKQRELEDSLKYGLAKDTMGTLLGKFINSENIQKEIENRFNSSFWGSLNSEKQPED